MNSQTTRPLNFPRGTTRWAKVTRVVLELADKRGKSIDAKIRGAIISLRVIGFDTTGSCQGHLNHGEPFPWIDIGVRTSNLVAGPRKKRSGGPATRGEWTRLKRTNLRQEIRMLQLIDKFYAGRRVPIRQRLILAPVGVYGAFQLTVQGGHVQGLLQRSVRKQRLAEFQREFVDFAAFLRQNAHRAGRTPY